MTFMHALLHIFGWMFIASVFVMAGMLLFIWLANHPKSFNPWGD